MPEPSLFTRFIRTYPKGEIVFEEGSPGQEMFIVRTGRVEIIMKGTEGPLPLAILGPGEVFGEMALVDDAPRSATATAMENDTQLVAREARENLAGLRRKPHFTFRWLRRQAAI